MALINKQQEYQDQEDWSNDVQKAKGYKELKDKVEYWAKQKDIDNVFVIKGSYEIVFDNKLGWCVNVDGFVSFDGLDIKEIPFQFRNVNGYFGCRWCGNLTSLKGCPIYVGGDFWCMCCDKLTSLEYCPEEVDREFNCSDCKNLTSLKYCPKEVGGDFCCNSNNLTSLEYCPKEVGGSFYCYNCSKTFTRKYVRSLCNVNGKIYVRF